MKKVQSIFAGALAKASSSFFEWKERGVEPYPAPERRGFGSRLTERIVASYFKGGGHTEFERDGIRFTLRGTLLPDDAPHVFHAL